MHMECFLLFAICTFRKIITHLAFAIRHVQCALGIYICSVLKGNFPPSLPLCHHSVIIACKEFVHFHCFLSHWIVWAYAWPFNPLFDTRSLTFALFCSSVLKSNAILIILFQLSMLFAPNQATSKLFCTGQRCLATTSPFNCSYYD